MPQADGPLTLDLPNAKQVELLVDRGPYLLGDANLDGRIDFVHLVTLARNYNQTIGVGGTGSFAGDLELLGGMTLEPSTLFGFVSIGTLLMTRRRTDRAGCRKSDPKYHTRWNDCRTINPSRG